MNKYIDNGIMLINGILKNIYMRVFHYSEYSGNIFKLFAISSEITQEYGSKLVLGRRVKMYRNSALRVRSGSFCKIDDGSSLGDGAIVACHESVIIGKNTLLSPYVLVYDHNHLFDQKKGGVKRREYSTAPVYIGDNVWIGAHCVILKGTKIGNNCVIGAGCILNGEYPDGSVIIQKRQTQIIKSVE